MNLSAGVDAHLIDPKIPEGAYIVLRNGVFSQLAQRLIGRVRIVEGIARDFGRVDMGGYYNIGKLIAAAYNGVPYSATSNISARDGNFANLCPENIVIFERDSFSKKELTKGVDANRIDPKIPEGYYSILRGGVYSHQTGRMIGKYRRINGLIVDFGMVELGRGNTYNVGKLIAAAYSDIPYEKFDISAPRDGDYTNICPENIVIITRSTYGGKTFQPYHEQNTKIPDSEIPIIRASKASNIALGKAYGVSEMQISRIRRHIDRTKV